MNVVQLLFHLCSMVILVSAFATRELRTRQALEPADVPPECTSACAPLFSQVQTCGSLNVACLCSTSVRAAGLACADCVAGVLPSQLEPLQQEVDQDVELCQQEGHPIAPATVIPSGSAPATMTGPSQPNPTDSSSNSGSSDTGNNTSGTAPTKSSAQSLSEYPRSYFTLLSMSVIIFVGLY